ncbi:hypothetical protein C8R45DRAFT_117879 [Mycena sanguinolenta]|nr:hypothetical protein C8R45DRAFT_194492 [Mycena sanguinolenta]KAJ6450638.1 hypothetical protein C8R45DRAFT_117879 [Mycena sanguinolenta]
MPLVCHKCGNSSWDTVPPQSSVVPALDIPGHRAALVEIQAKIARFKTFSTCYISVLQKQQHELEAELGAVVYPVLSLPPEIISRIFVQCLPDDGVSPWDGDAAPLVLVRVCRQWKDIALSTCQLWSSLRIQSVSDDKIKVPRGTLQKLQSWFSRARASPLSLSVTHNSFMRLKDSEELDISSFFNRLWRLDFPDTASGYDKLVPSDTHFPRLQCLSIISRDVHLKNVVAHAPLLNELHWSRKSKGAFDFRGFASTAMTTLHIYSYSGGFSPAEFIGILRHFPSLSHLECPVLPDSNPHHTPWTFPNLLSLSLLESNGRVPLIHALSVLTLPNLGCLGCVFAPFPSHSAVILSFLSRSACVIRELTCDFYEDPAMILQTLRLFPSLEKLEIMGVLDDVLSAIDPHGTTSPLVLPNLLHLKVICGPMTLARYRLIIDVLHARCAHPDTPPLRSLHVSAEDVEFTPDDGSPHCPIVAGLRSLAAGGLEFKVDVEDEVIWPVTARTP